jgi:hypothetical protein
VQYTILRGTQTFDVVMETAIIGFWERQRFDMVPKPGYVQLIPSYPLTVGVYCYFLNAHAWDSGRLSSDDASAYTDQACVFRLSEAWGQGGGS